MRSRELLDEFEAIENEEVETTPVLAEPDKHEVVENIQQTAAQATTPLQLWEHALEHPVALFVLPLFAFVNAGISVELSALPTLLNDSLVLGVVLGLVLGKAIGISLPTYALLKLKIGRLPDGVQQGHIMGLALLGGMGFTMSIFITTLGFAEQPEQQMIAKAGILIASLLAVTCGCAWSYRRIPAFENNWNRSLVKTMRADLSDSSTWLADMQFRK